MAGVGARHEGAAPAGTAGVGPVGAGAAPAAAPSAVPASPRDRSHLRLPLSFVVGRYFLYVLLGAAVVVGIPSLLFGVLLSNGSVLPANYAEQHVDEVANALASQDQFDADAIPSLYHYLHMGADGQIVAKDAGMDNGEVDRYLAAVKEQGTNTPFVSVAPGEGSERIYDVVTLKDGSSCVLSYRIMPEWADEASRSALPNPQDLYFLCMGVPLVALVVGVALRAAHVLTRKMEPLMAAADAVARQDLDAPVGASNVAQVDDVLAAMDRMRGSLKESLEAQWAAEQRQRDQIAALTHDLKTPLTVIRGNAELLLDGDLSAEDRACVEAVLSASDTADAFVAQIVATSHGEQAASERRKVDVSAFAEQLDDAAQKVVAARGLSYDGSCDDDIPAKECLWDADALERATMNLVSNACDHATGCVLLNIGMVDTGLRICVEDDGPGFLPEALSRGKERFFRGDAARSGSEPHFGLGLFIAHEVALTHGGSLELSNRSDIGGHGACAMLVIPMDV